MAYLKDRKNALMFSLSGLLMSFKKEKHMQLHALSTVLVIAAGMFFHISKMEWMLVSASICLVMITEILNTAIEKTCDLVTREIRAEIKYIKDISAAAVLLACVFALVCGIIIFTPYLQQLI